MNWIRRLFRHDAERDRKDVELVKLEEKAEVTVQRTDRVVAEQKMLSRAMRNTVRVLREAGHR